MIGDFFLLSLNNLRRRKLRAWLTMLGIFIGIAAVVSLISLGQGLQDAITSQFESLGGDKIYIQGRALGPPGSATSSELRLTSKDVNVLENVRGVEKVVGMLMRAASVKFKDEININYVVGFDEEYTQLFEDHIDIIEGRNIKGNDGFKAVIGYNHAYGDIWKKRDLRVGDRIEIEGHEFEIVGILKKTGNPFDDAGVAIPKEIMKEIFSIGDEESQIVVKVATGFVAADVAKSIIRKLSRARGESEDDRTFDANTGEQIIQAFSNIFAIVQGVLVGIAAISLIVGGIGIMNTMYTSVLERTKEIGTMKAVGAKNGHILLLFLIESGLLGLVGGAIGVFIGIGMAKGGEIIASQALGTDLLKASISPMIIFGALIFSFVVGCLSGVFPAYQASKLRPVDALRYE